MITWRTSRSRGGPVYWSVGWPAASERRGRGDAARRRADSFTSSRALHDILTFYTFAAILCPPPGQGKTPPSRAATPQTKTRDFISERPRAT